MLNYSMNHTVDEGLLYTKVWNMSMLQADDLTAAFTAYVHEHSAMRYAANDGLQQVRNEEAGQVCQAGQALRV